MTRWRSFSDIDRRLRPIVASRCFSSTPLRPLSFCPAARAVRVSRFFVTLSDGTRSSCVEELRRAREANPSSAIDSWVESTASSSPAGILRQLIPDRVLLLLLVRAYQLNSFMMVELDPLRLYGGALLDCLPLSICDISDADLEKKFIFGGSRFSIWPFENRRVLNLHICLKQTMVQSLELVHDNLNEEAEDFSNYVHAKKGCSELKSLDSRTLSESAKIVYLVNYFIPLVPRFCDYEKEHSMEMLIQLCISEIERSFSQAKECANYVPHKKDDIEFKSLDCRSLSESVKTGYNFKFFVPWTFPWSYDGQCPDDHCHEMEPTLYKHTGHVSMNFANTGLRSLLASHNGGHGSRSNIAMAILKRGYCTKIDPSYLPPWNFDGQCPDDSSSLDHCHKMEPTLYKRNRRVPMNFPNTGLWSLLTSHNGGHDSRRNIAMRIFKRGYCTKIDPSSLPPLAYRAPPPREWVSPLLEEPPVIRAAIPESLKPNFAKLVKTMPLVVPVECVDESSFWINYDPRDYVRNNPLLWKEFVHGSRSFIFGDKQYVWIPFNRTIYLLQSLLLLARSFHAQHLCLPELSLGDLAVTSADTFRLRTADLTFREFTKENVRAVYNNIRSLTMELLVLSHGPSILSELSDELNSELNSLLNDMKDIDVWEEPRICYHSFFIPLNNKGHALLRIIDMILELPERNRIAIRILKCIEYKKWRDMAASNVYLVQWLAFREFGYGKMQCVRYVRALICHKLSYQLNAKLVDFLLYAMFQKLLFSFQKSLWDANMWGSFEVESLYLHYVPSGYLCWDDDSFLIEGESAADEDRIEFYDEVIGSVKCSIRGGPLLPDVLGLLDGQSAVDEENCATARLAKCRIFREWKTEHPGYLLTESAVQQQNGFPSFD